MMTWILFAALLMSVVIALSSVFRDVWTQYRAGQRSLATALAITCIVAGVPVGVIATALEDYESTQTRYVVQSVCIFLLLAAGCFGAVGLVLDRRFPPKKGK